jgi:hypothetical protein
MQRVLVTVPPNAFPGMQLQATKRMTQSAPARPTGVDFIWLLCTWCRLQVNVNGQMVLIMVPQGVVPGQQLQVNVPMPAAVAHAGAHSRCPLLFVRPSVE